MVTLAPGEPLYLQLITVGVVQGNGLRKHSRHLSSKGKTALIPPVSVKVLRLTAAAVLCVLLPQTLDSLKVDGGLLKHLILYREVIRIAYAPATVVKE